MTSRFAPYARSAALISSLILSAALCGCSGSTSSAVPPVVPPTAVTGLATPTSMAVVTATNVQNAP
ncbi:MAG: hypothetical protein ACLQJ0_12845 [Steroidobacteraceae bacterium]|jgi:hypothetical protein